MSLTNVIALLAVSDTWCPQNSSQPHSPHHQPPFLFGAVSQSPCDCKKKSLCVFFGSGQFSATICLLLIALSVSPISRSLFFSLGFSTSLPIPANLSLFFFPYCICASHFFPKILENLSEVAGALRPRWHLATPPARCLFILKLTGRCWLLIRYM